MQGLSEDAVEVYTEGLSGVEEGLCASEDSVGKKNVIVQVDQLGQDLAFTGGITCSDFFKIFLPPRISVWISFGKPFVVERERYWGYGL